MSLKLILLKEKNPIKLIESACITANSKMLKQFMLMIEHLYQYDIFKPILDLTATKISEKFLSFKLHNQKFFDLDEGNCKTIYGDSINKLFNKIRTKNKYQITIKKLSYAVTIHEIAHMIEKEAQINLGEFMDVIMSDLNLKSTSIGLKNVIEQIFIIELKAYPENQKASEFFARYFQSLCLAKEISGLSATNGYGLEQVLSYFNKTTKWMKNNYNPTIIALTDAEISNISLQFLKKIDEIKHKWSEQKTSSIHMPGAKKWGSIIKSIKEL